MSKKLLSQLNWKDIDEIHKEIFSNDLFYYGNFEQIGKLFLSKALSIDVYLSTFAQIRAAVQSESNNSELPVSETDFYKAICDIYLLLIEEPRVHFVKLYSDAQVHLNEVSSRIAEIEAELGDIDRQKQARKYSIGEVDREAVLKYYLELNLEAKEEILSFLKDELKNKARIKATTKTLNYNLLIGVPYSYAFADARNYYTPKNPTDIDNKFLEETIDNLKNIKELYTQNRAKFNEYLTDYIAHEEVVFSIEERILSHHILFGRQNQLIELLRLYQQGNFSTFHHAAVSHIEGILTDCCLLFERDSKARQELEYEMARVGLGRKLDYLKEKFRWQFHYEYYYFRFRVLRNKIAHGSFSHVDQELIAGILLLDFYDVTNLACSLRMPVNRKVNTIKVLENDKKNNSVDYHFLLAYILLHDVDVPSFYQLTEQIQEIELLKNNEKFWLYLSDENNLTAENMKPAIHFALIILKRNPLFKAKAGALLTKLAYKPADNFDPLSFLDTTR